MGFWTPPYPLDYLNSVYGDSIAAGKKFILIFQFKKNINFAIIRRDVLMLNG